MGWSCYQNCFVPGDGSNCGRKPTLLLHFAGCAGVAPWLLLSEHGVRLPSGHAYIGYFMDATGMSLVIRRFKHGDFPSLICALVQRHMIWILCTVLGKMGFRCAFGDYVETTPATITKVFSEAGI